jgi:hypothetical protein
VASDQIERPQLHFCNGQKQRVFKCVAFPWNLQRAFLGMSAKAPKRKADQSQQILTWVKGGWDELR